MRCKLVYCLLCYYGFTKELQFLPSSPSLMHRKNRKILGSLNPGLLYPSFRDSFQRRGKWAISQEKVDFLRYKLGRSGSISSKVVATHCSVFSVQSQKRQDLGRQMIIRMPVEIPEAVAWVSITGLAQRESKCQRHGLLLDLGKK